MKTLNTGSESSELLQDISKIVQNSKIISDSYEDDELLNSFIEAYYPGYEHSRKQQVQIPIPQDYLHSQIIEQSSINLKQKINESQKVSDLSGFVVNIKRPREHSRSLQSLPQLRTLANSKSHKNLESSKLLNKKKQSMEFMAKRFEQKKGSILKEMTDLQKRCDKFGGVEFLKDEMDKQTVELKEAQKYYRNRIASIHGSISLPKIGKVRGIPQIDKLDMKTHGSPTLKKPLKLQYNKWYMKPEQRFLYKTPFKMDAKDSYIKFMLQNPNKNKQTLNRELGESMANSVLSKISKNPLGIGKKSSGKIEEKSS